MSGVICRRKALNLGLYKRDHNWLSPPGNVKCIEHHTVHYQHVIFGT